MPDKYSAVWVSHSSISDFQQCPRAYYLKNVYKNPESSHKIQIMAPALALGQAVHEVIESLSNLPTDQRLKTSLLDKFEKVWQKVSGKKGGFLDEETERKFKQRGEEMIRKVINNPGPVSQLTVKIKEELPHYWLSEDDGIILCGKIDWLQYLPDIDAVHIVDFKTSKNKEKTDSLQLPIYLLLVSNTQKRQVAKISYWYLGQNDKPEEVTLPEEKEAYNKVLKIAKEIKLARQLNRFRCPEGENGCYACRPFEKIIKGEAEFVGVGGYNQDIYILPQGKDLPEESIIL
ncbi:MAG: RecB family exonuclease [Patescibacteria group bacterium]